MWGEVVGRHDARVGARLPGGAGGRGAAPVRVPFGPRAQRALVRPRRGRDQADDERGRPHGGPGAERRPPAGSRPVQGVYASDRETRRSLVTRALVTAAAFAWTSVAAQHVDPARFAALRWRSIGPFRGGRTVAAVGVAGHPGLFYIGVNNGGVWKTTDYGRVWTPIFDDQATGSIGAIAVAPSDPNTIYVGSGEGLQRPDLSVGDGIYKSLDAGRSWTHLGLRDGQQIAQLAVDPRDANRVFAAVIGHPYGPNSERGIYRSTDGGQTWTQVLFKDENTGGMDVVLDPANAQTVFAVLWAARQAPWEAGWTLSANCGLYKSTDGGTTWRQITAGLPSAADGLGRIGLAVSPSASGRMLAVVGADKHGGVYRSDDGGGSWP